MSFLISINRLLQFLSLEMGLNLVFQSVKYAHQTMASYHSNFYDSLMIKLMVL